MPELTVAELASLRDRDYIAEVKARLRDDSRWVVLLDPVLTARTRWGLTRIIESIDEQKDRVAESGETDEEWLRRVNALRRYTKNRLDRMAPVDIGARSNTKEARAWRAFSARLARALATTDPDALDVLYAPYGGMTAAEWLSARDAKAAR